VICEVKDDGYKDNKRALLIDIAVPADATVEEKEQEKW